MLIFTAKLPRRTLAAWALAAAALCGCALLANTNALRLLHGPEVSAAALTRRTVKTEQDRLELLRECGWEVAPKPLAVEELQLPEQFEADMQEYLDLQRQQGFDLTDCAGKRVKRYTYAITNYPTAQTDVQVNLLVRKNTLVGGEVVCPRLDGFVHGLQRPADTQTPGG
ncbi:MAG: DUF4830 domain-containing protein [Oscillospiraceae bacterium]|nr:DUF4830 domain-containing protein [Oscillospiraceae bacterium]MBO5917326.1 DUF4830 domain-containing protein [Oscillospiraceae bacterium]